MTQYAEMCFRGKEQCREGQEMGNQERGGDKWRLNSIRFPTSVPSLSRFSLTHHAAGAMKTVPHLGTSRATAQGHL